MNADFKRGFKSVFSFDIKNKTRERVPNLSTEERIRRNWENVGKDMKKAMDNFDVKQNTKV